MKRRIRTFLNSFFHAHQRYVFLVAGMKHVRPNRGGCSECFLAELKRERHMWNLLCAYGRQIDSKVTSFKVLKVQINGMFKSI